MTFPEALSAPFAAALQKKGYGTLTAIQLRVLDPEVAGRDLRLSSQTGSGKTVAIGLILRGEIEQASAPRKGPVALVITPTRELARQVEEELSWLYSELGARVVSVTGGASVRDEQRALATLPALVVGTPGRLLDHLTRGALDPSALKAVVLDEADRMLDMGFREELLAIMELLPKERRAHLVSATFPREVARLAARMQQDPLSVEGTKLGVANADIEHLVHTIDPAQTVDAIVNILLSHPKGSRALIFCATRAEVTELAGELSEAGLGVSSISGDLEQRERTRALAGFKSGRYPVLVATDVAARGIDVQDIAIVIQVDAPNDADTYVHRSGRTGRAGRRGVSALLVSPRRLGVARRILDRARIEARVAEVPKAADLVRLLDLNLVEELSAPAPGDDSPDASAPTPRAVALAKRLMEIGTVELTMARLLDRSGVFTGPEPREIRPIAPPAPRSRTGVDPRGQERPGRRDRDDRPMFERQPRLTAPRTIPPSAQSFRRFRVTWGAQHGADARRLLAMICRRGGVSSAEVGSIDVGRMHSTVEIADTVAASFAEAASQRDPRDPRVTITADDGPSPRRAPPRERFEERPAPRRAHAEPGEEAADEPAPHRAPPPREEPAEEAAPPRRAPRAEPSEEAAAPRRAPRAEHAEESAPPRRAPRADHAEESAPPRRAPRADHAEESAPPRRAAPRADHADDGAAPRRAPPRADRASDSRAPESRDRFAASKGDRFGKGAPPKADRFGDKPAGPKADRFGDKPAGPKADRFNKGAPAKAFGKGPPPKADRFGDKPAGPKAGRFGDKDRAPRRADTIGDRSPRRGPPKR